jgi:hypothetical protein
MRKLFQKPVTEVKVKVGDDDLLGVRFSPITSTLEFIIDVNGKRLTSEYRVPSNVSPGSEITLEAPAADVKEAAKRGFLGDYIFRGWKKKNKAEAEWIKKMAKAEAKETGRRALREKAARRLDPAAAQIFRDTEERRRGVPGQNMELVVNPLKELTNELSSEREARGAAVELAHKTHMQNEAHARKKAAEAAEANARCGGCGRADCAGTCGHHN